MGRDITPAVLNTLGRLVADTWIFSASCVKYLGPLQLAEKEESETEIVNTLASAEFNECFNKGQ
jgi:hypothetical protein